MNALETLGRNIHQVGGPLASAGPQVHRSGAFGLTEKQDFTTIECSRLDNLTVTDCDPTHCDSLEHRRRTGFKFETSIRFICLRTKLQQYKHRSQYETIGQGRCSGAPPASSPQGPERSGAISWLRK